MSGIETRQYEVILRAVGDGREVTGRLCPYGEPADIRGEYRETLVSGSLVPIGTGVPLHLGHPSGEPHNEADSPISPPGELADDPAGSGMFGRWRVSRTPAGDSALDAIHHGRASGLSVGFIPSPEDAWSADRRTVTRHGNLLSHVALVTRGAYEGAKVLEVRASSLTEDQRKELASKGQALEDGSYPVPDKAHLHAAAVLAASGHGDVAAARKLIRKRAGELGVDVTTLPGFGDGAATEARTLQSKIIDLQGAGYAKLREVQRRDRAMRLAETDATGGRRTTPEQAVLALNARWTSGAAAREQLEQRRREWA